MSNSVLFLLLAFGLSVIGATAVWLHGRPRRHRRGPDLNDTLRALAQTREGAPAPNGVRPMKASSVRPTPRDQRRTSEPSAGA